MSSTTVGHSIVSRRHFARILALLSGGLVTGCATLPQLVAATPSPVDVTNAPSPSPSPNATRAPTATATPQLDIPQGVAAEYLRRWTSGDFSGMFELIIPGSPGAVDQDAFARRYDNIAREATVTDLVASLESNQRPQANIQRFRVTMRTLLVGTIEQQLSLTLAPRAGTWRIQWLPSLIFKDLTGDQLVHLFPEFTPRGQILDATGQVLAGQGDAVSVGILPGKIANEAELIGTLAPLLHMTPDAIRGRYREAPADVAVRIRLLGKPETDPIRAQLAALPGVDLTDVHVRTYPSGKQAAAAIGYLGEVTDDDLDRLQRAGYRRGDLLGRAGIEAWGEFYLASGKGGRLAVTTRDFQPVTTIAQRPARPASNVTITLDHRLQTASETALGQRQGAVVLAQIRTGVLLAVAGSPSFDPNAFVLGLTEAQWLALSQDPHQPLRNRPTGTAYPAGPAAHAIALAMALDRSLVQPDTTVPCSGSWIPADGIDPLLCWKRDGHGTLSVVDGLKQSCDVAAYQLGHLLDQHDRHLLSKSARACGLGSATGVIGIEEAQGLTPDPTWKLQRDKQPWSVVDAALLAAGRDATTSTALQVAMLAAAIGSGGPTPTPRLVAQATSPDGSILFTPSARQNSALPFGEAALSAIRGVFSEANVPTKRLKAAGIAGPAVGKGPDAAGAWFLGYGPADQPEVAVAVFLEGGSDQVAAATTIAADLLDAYRAVRG